MKSLSASLLLTLVASSQAGHAATYTFGDTPYQYVESAGQYNGPCTWKQNQIMAYLLAPTWRESAGFLPNKQPWAAPSPMTLSRNDPNQNPKTGQRYRLIPNEKTESGAVWHPGIGMWQLDDGGLGSSATMSNDRFDSSASSSTVARWMFGAYQAAGCKPTNIYSPWNASKSCGPTYAACFSISSAVLGILNNNGSLPPESVDRYGGGVPHECSRGGQTFACTFIDPANAQPKGQTSNWSMASPNLPLRLAQRFYVFYSTDSVTKTAYEWRYWLAEDTLNGHDIAARRQDGMNSRTHLCWISGASDELTGTPDCNLTVSSLRLCDLGPVGPSGLPEGPQRGSCSGSSNLAVTLTAMPSTGRAPLNGVTLVANVNGVPNETINYTFYCDRSDSGVDIRPGWSWKHDGISRPQVRLPGVCNYSSARTYTAKVIVEQGNGAAESRLPITVGSGSSCFSLILTVNNPNGGNTPSASPAESAGCAPSQYVAGETIGLTAAPASGWMVGSWVGTQNDASTSATNSFTMPASSHTVTVNYVQAVPSPISIVTTSLPDAPPNQPYSVQLAASGGTSTGYTWSLEDGSLPAGLTLNALTGVINGTPTQAGTLSQFTIRVRDSGGNSTIRRFSLYVLPASGLTILSNGPSNFVFYVGTPYTSSNSLTYLATGGQAPYSWKATGLPPGLQIDAAGGFLYGTPTQTGSSQVEITATDSTGETGTLLTVLTVSKTAIIVTDSSGHTPPSPPPAQVGTSYQFFFNAAGGSQSGYTWSISQGNLPPGLTSQNGPGCPTYCSLEVTGTPTLAGTYTFTVAVTDSLNDHGSQVATIVVNSGTPPSIATSQLPTATIGASYSATLSATGGTPPYRWSFVGSAPDPGIQISQDGTLTGITQNTNDCPTGSSDHLGGIWVGAGYPSTYFQVIVTDAAGQSSAKQLCLVSYYPRPEVASDSPQSITIDGQNHTITLNGSNFRSTSYIVTNGGATLPTTYIGPNALSFTLYPNYPGPLCANQNGTTCFDAGTPFMQSVIEPYSNISLSSANFAIYNPPPTVTSVMAVLDNTNQPCTANQLCQLVVNGSGFSFHWDTSFLIAETNTSLTSALTPSTPPPWSQIITSAFSLPSGTYTLQVTNAHQAGGSDTTVSATFHVN